MLREGVTVKESRGRLSYLTPDRTKPITARKLGDDFDKATVLALLTQNARRAAEQTKAIPEYPAAVKKPSQGEKTTKTTPADNTLQRMVDREAKRAEGKGVGYDRWAAKHNLKQMAATVTAYQQYGFSSPEELDEACSAAYAAMQESLAWLKQVEKTLNGKKELQRQVLAYSKTRPVRDGLKQQKNAKAKAAYRQKHESDFIIADAAARYFRENGISKLPSYKSLQAEIESLIKEKNSGYNDYRAKRRSTAACRLSRAISTRFYAGASRSAERSRAMNGNIPRMDYRQYRAARRLVHECCNYDSGNCLLLEDGEPCVCVQSISYSLLCRWFTAAVLPLDEALEAALLRRGSRKRCAVCGAFFFPKSNRGKYCPDCAGRMKRINAAKRKRKQREKCHALGHFKPA